MKKKILSLFLVVFLAIVAIGCNFSGGKITIEPSGDEPAATIDLDEVFLNIESQIPNRDSLTGDITLPTKFGQVAISWVSDNPIVIDANGHVTRPDVDTTVILRCTLVSPTETKRYEVHVIVKAKENTNITPEYVLAKLDADKQGTYYGDGVVVVVEESKVTITEPNGKVLTFDIYIENNQYFVLEEGTKIICTFGDGTVTNSKGTFSKKVTPEYVLAKLDADKQGTYYGDGVVVVVEESKVTITEPNGKVLTFDIYIENDQYFVLEEGTKIICTFGDGTVTNSKGTFSKKVTPEYVLAKLDADKQGTYYGDGVVVVVEESKVTITEPNGKVLTFDIYIENDQYFVLEEGTKIICTFGDGTVTNSKGTFTKTQPTPTPVVAHLDTTKQGTYYGDGVVVVISESEVSVTDATGKVLKYTIYVEDNKYYVLDGDTKDYCIFGDGSVTNSKGTFTKTQPTPTPVVAHLDTTKQGTYYGDGVVVVIGESEVSVTDATGKVLKYTIYVEDNKYYVLDGDTKDYCTFGDGSVTNSKGTFTKTPPTPTSYTISDVKAGEIGKTYNIKATVVAVSAVSFLLQDDTDTILVYLGASYEKDLAVGDEIEFSGKTGTYSGTIQFTTAQYTKLGTKTISYPQPTVLSASDIDALVSATPVTQYVKVEAVLKISGNYLNLEFEGTKAIGSLVRPVDSLLDYNNKVVIVTGYYLYVTGSSTKYVNFLMTEIEESSTPAPQLEDVTIAVVLAGEVGERYRTMGTIVAVSAVSLVLQDETGAIVCNFGSDFAYSTYRIGLKMAVEGPTQLHGGSVQINYPQVALLTEVGANYPVPRELEFNDLLELNGQAPEYVMLTGKLVKSGNYYNLDMGDPYIFGALATPTEDIDGFVGKDIVVKGFYDYTTTSGDKTYVYFIYTSIEVVAASNGDEEIVDEIIASYTDFEFMDVVNNLLLPEGSDGVTMTWVSTNEDVLESNGTYHMPSEPTDVTFILTVSKGEVSKSTNVTFHVVGVESIASVKENTEYGSYHIIKGITIATAREGFVLQDETGMIYCSTASYRGDLEIGDEVIVKGPTQLYGNIVQIAKYELNYEKTGEKVEVTFPEAIALDADTFASLFETTDIIFVQVSGTLEAGEYLSILNVEGTEIVGGLLHPNLMEYDGMDITVKGYFIDSVWGYKQFNQIVVTDVTVDSASNVDQNKVTRVVEDITKSFDGQKMYYPVNYYPDFEDVTVTWTSSNEDVFAIGEITKYQDTETVVTLTAVVECGEVSQTVVVNVIVPAITPTTGVTADDSEQTFVVCGTIVAATNESVLLQDNAGTILIYFGKYQCPEVLSVGAKIYYVGTVTTYAGIIEFNFGGYYVIEYLDVDYPEAIELNGEGCEALVDTTEVKYVKITGDLLINGSYVNFYPVGSELALSIISPNEDLTELNNYRITLTGYYVYTSGSSTKYPSIMMTDYEVYEWSDEEIVDLVKNFLDSVQNQTLLAGVTFTFPEGVEVTWASDHTGIISNELEYHSPAEDTLVTLVATITYNEVTKTATSTYLCKAPATISTIFAAEDYSERFLVKGTVVAVSTVSFVIKDETAQILVYYGDTFEGDLEIGDEVEVRGYAKVYYGTIQISSEVGYTKTGNTSEVEYPSPIELDSASFDALLNTTDMKYVKVTGQLRMSDGYYNLYVSGSDLTGSIVSPTDEKLKFADGTYVTITGYYLYSVGSEKKYISIIPTSLEYEEVEPIYGYYLTGTEFANWQLNVEYTLKAGNLEGEEIALDNTYAEADLAALTTALEERGVTTFYYMEVVINQITDTWTDFAIINGEKVELSGSFAFKVLYGYEITSGAVLEKWIPSETGGRVESLTPNTVFASDNWQDEVDSNGFNWNSNLMVTNGMGKYLLVFVDYNTESSMEQAGYGVALLKAAN